jgi:hypothetical protein
MAVVRYHNLVGSTAAVTSLIPIGSNCPSISSIMITNTRANDTAATVSLYLESSPADASPEIFYILNSVNIPRGTSLLLDNKGLLKFDNSNLGFSLDVETGTSDTLDV